MDGAEPKFCYTSAIFRGGSTLALSMVAGGTMAVARAAFGSELLALLSAPVGSGRGPPAAAVRPVTLGHVKRAGA